MLSSGNFMISSLTFKSLVYFEFFFVYSSLVSLFCMWLSSFHNTVYEETLLSIVY